MVLEPWEREAGLWRPPLALGRLLEVGLGSAVLRAGVLLTDFLGTSVGGRSRALEAARWSPTSAPTPRERREVAGDGDPAVGPEESGDKAEGQRVIDTSKLVLLTAQELHSFPGHLPLRAPALGVLLLGAPGDFPLLTGSSAGGRIPFCPRGPSLGTRVGAVLRAETPVPCLTSQIHIFPPVKWGIQLSADQGWLSPNLCPVIYDLQVFSRSNS